MPRYVENLNELTAPDSANDVLHIVDTSDAADPDKKIKVQTLLGAASLTDYLKLSGRVGGQSGVGGTQAGESLTLAGTSHATKGPLVLQPNGGQVGIGRSAPTESAAPYILQLERAAGDVAQIIKANDARAWLRLESPANQDKFVQWTEAAVTKWSIGSDGADGVFKLDEGGTPGTLPRLSVAAAGDLTLTNTGATLVFQAAGNLTLTRPSGNLFAKFLGTAGTTGLRLDTNSTGDVYVDYQLVATTVWTAGLDNSDGDAYKISEGGAPGTNTRLTIAAGGAVGLGTEAPGARVEIYRNANANADLLINNPNAGTAASARVILQSDTGLAESAALVKYSSSHATYPKGVLLSNAVGDVVLGTAAGGIVRLTAAGLVGIGTQTPLGKLHVFGTNARCALFEALAVAGTPVTLIPDGTGDVTKVVTVSYAIRSSAGAISGATGALGVNGTLVDANITFAVSSVGALTVVRSSGTSTYDVAVWAVWQ